MIGSEVCPFINYVNKTSIKNNILKYSILVSEKNIVLESEQYICDIHKSCILYKDLNGTIKHLEECEFWYNENYWEKIHPQEKEIITK
jgi:hypothetical protein